MKKKTIAKQAMYRNVFTVLNSNQALWSSLPVFADAVTRFQTAMGQLDAALLAQETALRGTSQAKKNYLEEMRNELFAFKQALYMHAFASGNTALKERHLQTSALIKRSSPKLVNLWCVETLADVLANEAALSEVGITAERIQGFQSLLQEFDAKTDSTRMAIINRKTQTYRIAAIESNLDQVLKLELDRFSLYLKGNAPEFYFAYKSARKVVESNGRGEKPFSPTPERDDGAAA